MRRHRNPIGRLLRLVQIVAAPLDLRRSEPLTPEMKGALTRIDGVGWAVILLPATGVGLWLKARGRRD
jgi:hypothetical protein